MRIGRVTCLVLAVLSLVLLALPIACLATITAPWHTPFLIEKVVCPEGSHLEIGSQRETWNVPGEATLTGRCVDQAGNVVPMRPLDERRLAAGLVIYYPVILVLLACPTLLMALLVWGVAKIAGSQSKLPPPAAS